MLLSLVALLFSGYGVYESSLRAPELSTFVAPRIDYTHPDGAQSVREVFILPMTIANGGARSATVLAINLEVTNPRTKQVKNFYAARLGTWGEAPIRPFAPLALAGKATFTQALQFAPHFGEQVPRILDSEPGSYQFKLTLDTAATKGGSFASSSETALQFIMEAGPIDYRMFQGSGTMTMWSPDNRSAASFAR